jgi:glycosyltransferase involved in cell wall biosynthesis
LTKALAERQVCQTFVLPKVLPVDSQYVKVAFANSPYFTQIHVNMEMQPYGQITDFERNYLRRRRSLSSFYTKMVNDAYEYADIIRDLAGDHSHDVIHGHDWMTYPAAMAAQEVSGRPMVLHIHATEFDRTLHHSHVNPEVAEIEYQGLSRADRVIAVSNYTKNLIADKYSIPKSKIDVVHNGIDLSEFDQFDVSSDALNAFARGKKVVIFMGRITAQKGTDYFVKVASRISGQVPEALFVVAGDGDMYQHMLLHSAAHNLTGKLLFSGFLRSRNKMFLYKRADLFIMPSVSEPFGLVALEAAAADTPVIISKQSGVAEVLSNALTADYWDVDDMARKAVSVLRDDDYRGQLCCGGAREVKEINWGRAADQCLRVYRELA